MGVHSVYMDSTTLTILLFAQARDVTGQSAVELPWSGGTCDALRAALAAAVPQVAPLLGSCAVAVNQQVALPTTLVHAGDEVAILPPFGGG